MRNKLIAAGLALQLIVPLAAATGLTLNNNFQALPVAASVACALAYNTVIPNCVVADFRFPNTCSDACVAGLLDIADGVNADCFGLQAGEKTLIAEVLNGQIIPSVCPRNQASSSSSAKKSTTATNAAARSTSVISTRSSPAVASSFTMVASTSSAPSAAAATTTTSSQAAAQQQGTSTATTASSSAAPSKSNGSRKGLTMKQQQIAAESDSRGGSPFDVIGYSSAASMSKQQMGGILWAMVAVCWTMMAWGR